MFYANAKDLEFGVWMVKVDDAVKTLAGISADDLADYCYRDAFEDGLSPKQAARRAIKADRESY
jgi:Family of unknown function (DUF5419)